MRTIAALATVGVALLTLGIGPAAAQQAERAFAISTCTVPPVDTLACNAAVEAFILALGGLPADQADALLAEFVFDLASAATDETRSAIGAAILVAAAAIQDPTRSNAAIEVAALVVDGGSLDGEVVSTAASGS